MGFSEQRYHPLPLQKSTSIPEWCLLSTFNHVFTNPCVNDLPSLHPKHRGVSSKPGAMAAAPPSLEEAIRDFHRRLASDKPMSISP